MEGLSAIIFICFAASSFLRERMTAQADPIYNVVDYGAAGDGRTDDSQAFLKAWTNVCSLEEGSPTLLIPGSKTFMLQPVAFQGPCKPSTIYVQIEGNITAPGSVNAWKWADSDKKDAYIYWIQFSEISGLAVYGGGSIDGQGAPWWDCFAQSKCKRPKALHFHSCDNLGLGGLTVANSPKDHISVHNCSGSWIGHMHLVSPQDSPNTDGIDISKSSNIVVTQSSMQVGDDCIAINGVSSFFDISGINCGPGHGIRIGSLGKEGSYAQVEEIHVRNCTFTKTKNGARIKTWEGGSGYARKITFEDIKLVQARRPVIINQHYRDSSIMDDDDDRNAVKISDITYRNFIGTSSNVNAVQLLCDDVVACTDIVLDQIHIVSSVAGKGTHASCSNAYGISSPSNVPKVQCLSGISLLVSRVVDS